MIHIQFPPPALAIQHWDELYAFLELAVDHSNGELDEVTTIQQIYPHITSPNAVGIQIGSQQSPNGPVTWKPEVTFDPNTDRKVDMRTTGVLHAYRIIARDVKSDFTISGMDILYVQAGRR